MNGRTEEVERKDKEEEREKCEEDAAASSSSLSGGATAAETEGSGLSASVSGLSSRPSFSSGARTPRNPSQEAERPIADASKKPPLPPPNTGIRLCVYVCPSSLPLLLAGCLYTTSLARINWLGKHQPSRLICTL